jgi:acetyl esterase/lipase
MNVDRNPSRQKMEISHTRRAFMGRCKPSLPSIVLSAICLVSIEHYVMAQTEVTNAPFAVTIDKPENGSITIEPSLPEDGKVAPGTVLTIKASPAAGFALDSGYYSAPGMFGKMYYEFMSPVFQVTIDQNKGVGASFIEQKTLEGFTVTQDIVYAQPGVKKLKYDVYSPNGAKNLPCIVIIHGGGWAANTEDIMRGLARELVRNARYVVTSIDYRWIGTRDGDKVPNAMANLIEDVYGAIAHIQEHAERYGADPGRIAVTGDSAGGHLSAAAIDLVERIGDGGFGVKEGVYQFKPTYMPPGKSVEQVRNEITQAIKVAAPSYGVFGGGILARVRGGNSSGDQSEAALKAIAPLDNISNIKDRAVPQYLLRGTLDTLIQNTAVQGYADALKAAGQTVEYVQVEGAGHAFFDWKPDAQTKKTFTKYGVPYAAKMQQFFDSVFYPNRTEAQRP